MQFDLYECDWCGAASKSKKKTQISRGVWPERNGLHPSARGPELQDLIFCSNSCDEKHRWMGNEADKAASAAWMSVFYKRTSIFAKNSPSESPDDTPKEKK